MSSHEYLSDHLWLVKRMAALNSLCAGLEPQQPSRHPLAGLLALFIPRLGVGGGSGSILVMMFMVGILAAIAIPQFQEYQHKAAMAQAVATGKQATVAVAVANYYYANAQIPESLTQAGFTATGPRDSVQHLEVDQQSGIVTVTIATAPYTGKTISFEPSVNQAKQIIWACSSTEIPAKVLPQECR